MKLLEKADGPMPTGAKNKEGPARGQPSRSTAPRRLATKPHTSLLRLLDAVHRALVASSCPRRGPPHLGRRGRAYAINLVEWVLGGSGRFNRRGEIQLHDLGPPDLRNVLDADFLGSSCHERIS